MKERGYNQQKDWHVRKNNVLFNKQTEGTVINGELFDLLFPKAG